MDKISGEDSSGDKEIVKLKRDTFHQSDHKGEGDSEGPGPEGEGEQAGEEHGAAPANRLSPAPLWVGCPRFCEAFADQSSKGVSQEHSNRVHKVSEMKDECLKDDRGYDDLARGSAMSR